MNRFFTLIGLFLLLLAFGTAQKNRRSRGCPSLSTGNCCSAIPKSPALNFAGRKVHRFPETVEGQYQHLGEENGRTFSSARLLTTETKRPIPGYLWSRDGKYIAYAKDFEGDENFNVYAVDPLPRRRRKRSAAFARHDRIEGRSGATIQRPEERSRRSVYRPE